MKGILKVTAFLLIVGYATVSTINHFTGALSLDKVSNHAELRPH